MTRDHSCKTGCRSKEIENGRVRERREKKPDIMCSPTSGNACSCCNSNHELSHKSSFPSSWLMSEWERRWPCILPFFSPVNWCTCVCLSVTKLGNKHLTVQEGSLSVYLWQVEPKSTYKVRWMSRSQELTKKLDSRRILKRDWEADPYCKWMYRARLSLLHPDPR